MKLSETFKNTIKSDDFLMARGARRENFRNLRWKVSDFSVSQPLVKYPMECSQEKKLYCPLPALSLSLASDIYPTSPLPELADTRSARRGWLLKQVVLSGVRFIAVADRVETRVFFFGGSKAPSISARWERSL